MRVASGVILQRPQCHVLQPAEPSMTLPSSTGLSLPNAQFVAAANLKAVDCFFLARQPRVTHANKRGQRTAVEGDPKERGTARGKRLGLET